MVFRESAGDDGKLVRDVEEPLDDPCVEVAAASPEENEDRLQIR